MSLTREFIVLQITYVVINLPTRKPAGRETDSEAPSQRGMGHSIVVIFGWSLGGFIVAMIAVIVGLLAGGPVGRFKVAAGRDGASLEADCPPPSPSPPERAA